MVRQCLAPSITKKIIVASGTTTTYCPSNTKFSLKYFTISKSIETFLIQTIPIVMPKNTNTEKF